MTRPGPGPLPAPAHRIRRARLFVDVQHGLCNRLRTMASAAGLAARSGRDLVVVWRPDHHCEARIGALLDYPGPVIEEDDGGLLRRRAARVYNYMEIEPGARYGEPVLDPAEGIAGDVYLRAADTLVSPLADPAAEQRFLRGLRPAAAVLDLARRVPPGAQVALHVRMGTGPDFDHLSYESPANWPPGRHAELTAWRRKSDVSRFTARLDALVAAGEAETIFAAADLPATYAVLAERYGPRLRFLRRELYDRSARQLQYALADLVLLASSRRLLASTWSSFSDVARRLAPPGSRFEQSGVDF